jgi:nitrogen fixation NifU-like protein
MDLHGLYQDITRNHGHHPRNFRPMGVPSYNSFCGDKITVYLKLNGDHINNVSFEGRGCAISTASELLITEIPKDKNLHNAGVLFAAFHAKVAGGNLIGVPISQVEDRKRFDPLTGVKAFPNYVKCTTLARNTLESAVKGRGHDATAGIE